jgi:hypothetical protein
MTITHGSLVGCSDREPIPEEWKTLALPVMDMRSSNQHAAEDLEEQPV